MVSVESREFRFIIITEKYDDTISFYRDSLDFPVIETWDQGTSDRGTLFEASSGIIEVIATPLFSDPAAELLTPGRPQGATVGIEVEDVDKWYEKVRVKRLPIKRGLSDLPWEHRGFSVTDPNQIAVYIFSKNRG